MCAQAYMVTRKGAQDLIRNTWPFYSPWDVMPMLMHKSSKNGEFKMLSTTPRLFDQDRTLGPSLHTDENPECHLKMANRFVGEQWAQLVDNEITWGADGTLSFTGRDDVSCPQYVDPDAE